MADIGLKVVALQVRTERMAKVVSGCRLSEGTDVVASALDG
jgi:hypothetical protein